MQAEIVRVPHEEIVRVLSAALVPEGMSAERAEVCAKLFADASRDGVPSHGLNRFGLFVKWIRAGTVLPAAELTRVAAVGGLERWDGGFGPGPWNAFKCMGRAIELAKAHGIGCVGLRRTNHWMRAGNYGWQAADAGCIGLCWTNTIALMPAWGSKGAGKGRRVGNNPLVIAVPGESGRHVVVDMAMSQYSMGKLTSLRNAGEKSPLPAGFDAAGELTHDPEAVAKGGAAMPIGQWKGAGLAMLLDIAAAVVSGGAATRQIRAEENERGVSQVFMAIDAAALGGTEGAGGAAEMDAIVAGVVEHLKAGGEGVLYPGERSMKARQESMEKGVPVERAVWEAIIAKP